MITSNTHPADGTVCPTLSVQPFVTVGQAVSPAKRFFQASLRGLTVLTLLSILAFAEPPRVTPAQTQDAQSPSRPVRVIVPPQRIGILTQADLTLDEAVALVLSNNQDIESSRIDRQIASLRLVAARGVFDPRVGADGTFLRSTSPVSSSLGGGAVLGQLKQMNFSATPQFSGLIPHTGGSYSVSYASSRNTTDLTFATLNPQFPTTLTFSLTQPLFRNLRYDDSRRQIEIGKKNVSLSDEQFRQRVLEVTTQAVDAYWDLVYAFKNLQIQIEAVDLARRQVESNQRQVDQGILAPIDIVEAETQLSTFEQGLYTAQQALTRAEDVLKALMLRERTAPLWSAALVPVTPVNVEAPSVEFPEAIKEALGSRPELAQVQLSLDVNQANNRYFREQTKPQVDLVASYAGSGLAGQPVAAGPNPFTASTAALTDRINTLSQLQGLTPLPVISGGISGAPPFFIGGYGTSLSNLTSWNYPSANASLKISLPLRNRTAEANLAASIADGRRLEVQRRQIEQRVESDVRDTLQGVQSTRERLNAAVMARQSSEEQYQSEQRKFQEGTSTVFLVLQRQTAMITARNGELRAQTDLSKAIADFERSTTRTFTVRNIQIQGSKP